MSLDLLSYLGDAVRWAGDALHGGEPGAHGAAAGGAGPLAMQSRGDDLLGGMAGGFCGPMDWKGAGFGGGVGGAYTGQNGGFASGYAGLGFGGMGSSWDMTQDGKQMSGVSGVAGGVAPVGVAAGSGGDWGAYANTNVYSGVGGSAYEYSKGTDSGIGFNATAAPIGLGNTNYGVSTPIADYKAHVDNAYLDRVSVSGSAGNDNGNYHADGSAAIGMGVQNANSTLSTGVGDVKTHVGSFNYGTGATAGGSYDSNTGALNGHASVNDGIDAKDLHVGYNSPGGDVQANANVGEVQYGYQGSGSVGYDPNTGTATAKLNEGTRGGGVVVKDSNLDGSIAGVGSGHAHLGEFSNDTTISGDAVVDANHARVTGNADGMGMRFKDFNAGGQIGDGPNAVKANASVGDIGNTNSINGAYVDVNWADPALHTGFSDISYGSWGGHNLNASLQGPGGLDANAHVGEFSTGLSAKNFQLGLDKNGLDASLESGMYRDFDIQDVQSNLDWGPLHSHAELGELGSDKTELKDAGLKINGDGLDAHLGHGSYDEVYIKGLKTQQGIDGVYGANVGLGEGSMNHGSMDNAYLRANGDGVQAGFDNGQYGFLQGKNIDIGANVGDGAIGVGAHADQASLGTVDVGHLDYSSNGESSHLGVQNLDAAGWKSKNLNANANVGALGANAGAQQLNLADLSVKSAHANTSNYGLTGNADVQGANFDAVNMKGGHAGLSWGGQEMLGATADFKSGGGVESANASWDATHLAAAAQFKNASFGSQLSNADVDIAGMHFGLPDMGYKVNATGGASVDASQLAASANLGLGGTSVNFGGYEMTVPDWVQASAGLNLSHGAANFNLGGDDGIGASMDLSEGELKFDAFGYECDVGGAVSDAWDSVSDW